MNEEAKSLKHSPSPAQGQKRMWAFLRSGTAKGGRPWRGSVIIEPGFFQVFKKPGKSPVKTWKKPGFFQVFKKPGKSPVKARKKPEKNLLEIWRERRKLGIW